MEKPKALKDEHIQYLQNSFDNIDILSIVPYLLNEFPDLNAKESYDIVQYLKKVSSEKDKEDNKIQPKTLKIIQKWMENSKKNNECQNENINLKNEKQLKIFAISFSNKMFRVIIEINKKSNQDIKSIFPSFKHVELCDFIYDLYHKKILKNRYGNDMSYETINTLFGYLPLITMKEFTIEINGHFKINLK